MDGTRHVKETERQMLFLSFQWLARNTTLILAFSTPDGLIKKLRTVPQNGKIKLLFIKM